MTIIDLLERVRRIEVRTNRLVNDTMVSAYLSHFKGRGMDFEELREYIPGDDGSDHQISIQRRAVAVKKTILQVRAIGIILSLLLSWSNVTADSFHPQLPADVTINKDAGRGNLLFVALRLEDGEELPFFVDTGSTFTSFDKSLESKLGKRAGRAALSGWGVTKKAAGYVAPKLYLGNTPLMTGSRVYIGDFKQLSSQTCCPVMGVLGMDCLRYYCIQLDFEAGKIRFLDSDHMNDSQLGTAFPLTFRSGCPFIHQGNLAGEEGTNLLVDAGYRGDGALESGFFQREVHKLQSKGKAISGQHVGHIWFSNCVWNGENYTNLLIGDGGTNFSKGQGGNEIGLRFLARHLVTFDFPNQIMYLKQTRVGPLVDEKINAARKFLNDLRGKGQLPGWSINDEGTIYLEPYPNFEAFDGAKNGNSSVYHYKITQASEGGSWKLQKAWRTDQDGKTIEEFPLP